jgi:microcystin degradation protein MlrC
MIERDLPGSIFVHLYDPEVAQLAIRSGVGSKISCLLGGKVDTLHGTPIELKDAEVMAVADGKMISNSPMMMGIVRDIGPTARLRTGNVEIIVASAQRQTMDDQPFVICGTKAENYRYIGIKSNVHFKAYYKDHAALIFAVDTPGHRSGDPEKLYSNIRRPIFPLDAELNDAETLPAL